MSASINDAHPGLFTSKSDRWFTPPDLLAEISAFLGDYLDPCPATAEGMPEVNGLAIPWRGRVYLNPPYGRAIGSWVRKAMTDPLDEAILLVPARTETSWFQPLLAESVCFLRGRLHFVRPGSTRRLDGAPFPSALVYRGWRHGAFAKAFAHRGVTMRSSLTTAGVGTLWEAA